MRKSFWAAYHGPHAALLGHRPHRKDSIVCLLFSNSPFCSLASIRVSLNHHHYYRHDPPMIQHSKIYLGLWRISPYNWDLCLYPSLLPGTASSASQPASLLTAGNFCEMLVVLVSRGPGDKTSSHTYQSRHPQTKPPVPFCVFAWSDLQGHHELEIKPIMWRNVNRLSAKKRREAVCWQFHCHYQE